MISKLAGCVMACHSREMFTSATRRRCALGDMQAIAAIRTTLEVGRKGSAPESCFDPLDLAGCPDEPVCAGGGHFHPDCGTDNDCSKSGLLFLLPF